MTTLVLRIHGGSLISNVYVPACITNLSSSFQSDSVILCVNIMATYKTVLKSMVA